MGTSSRLFNCGWCHTAVIIHSHHDRGNTYCGLSCSRMARQKSLRSAGKKYQNTRKGKFNNAERQKRYRERQKQLQKK